MTLRQRANASLMLERVVTEGHMPFLWEAGEETTPRADDAETDQLRLNLGDQDDGS